MDFSELETRIGYCFRNKDLLKTALTHSSYANEEGHGRDNERLEFLGDSVLGFITAEYLFSLYRNRPEGELTKLRAALVCEKSLFRYAGTFGLGDALLMGHGEEMTGGRTRPSVVSDAFEALLAAIYLDGGLEPASAVVLPFIKEAVRHEGDFRDNKSLLQEKVQQNKNDTLTYVGVDEYGPPHNKRFVVEARVNGKTVGVGEARSKKEAEQAAAGKALEFLSRQTK